jgi:energy-coupling factor transporter transmembrane protein EcfT
MNNQRRMILVFIAVIAAIILAVPLRFMLELFVVFPLQYVFWILYQFYEMMPQQIVWIVALLFVALIGFSALYNVNVKWKRKKDEFVEQRGKVEMVASWIDQSRGGIYFKWRIARLLAEVDEELSGGRERFSVKDRDPAVSDYLDAGLRKSFADFPINNIPFTNLPIPNLPIPNSTQRTPFDIPLEDVLNDLESKNGDAP